MKVTDGGFEAALVDGGEIVKCVPCPKCKSQSKMRQNLKAPCDGVEDAVLVYCADFDGNGLDC